MTPSSLAIAFSVSVVAGAMNSIAGGGTLLTFPSLLQLGLDSKIANATSTVGLWPGSLGGAWGYRDMLTGGRRNLYIFCGSSLLGGATGAVLLLWTHPDIFDRLVPLLILTATVLFMAQGRISAWLNRKQAKDAPHEPRWAVVLPAQFLIGVYGGYFGAGIGILMLACLGLLGIDNIHERNGVKNVAALFINGIAVILFVIWGMVRWPIALTMAAGAIVGGYFCAGFAKRAGPKFVRATVITIGLLAAASTAHSYWNG